MRIALVFTVAVLTLFAARSAAKPENPGRGHTESPGRGHEKQHGNTGHSQRNEHQPSRNETRISVSEPTTLALVSAGIGSFLAARAWRSRQRSNRK